jgi:hypothetical protein
MLEDKYLGEGKDRYICRKKERHAEKNENAIKSS